MEEAEMQQLHSSYDDVITLLSLTHTRQVS